MSDLRPITNVSLHPQPDQERHLLELRDDRNRVLRIHIGICEARAIQMILENESFSRPLTPDLLMALTEHLEVSIARVIIDDFSNGTIFSRLLIDGPEGQLSLDCRPSDGIALALRAKAPILVSELVMNAAE